MKIGDVERVRKNFNPPVLTVIKALYVGLEVKLGDYTYILVEGNNSGQHLAIRCVSPEDEILGMPISFSDLTALSNKLSQQELILLAANITLNKIGSTFFDRKGNT